DALRGFALLGILMMNIQSFGLIDSKYTNPMAQGALTGIEYFEWLIGHLFFDSKMMAIFSALFGAGIVLMWEKALQANRKFTWLHYRRMFWLMLFGLAHGHLLWHGDILVPYALCGMIVYWFCGLRSHWLLWLGFLLLLIGSVTVIFVGMSIPYWPEEQVAEMSADWTPSAKQIAANKAIYLGSWIGQLPHRSAVAFMMETFLFLMIWIWRVGGLMLIGMGLFKMGVFQAQRSPKFYWIGFVSGLLIGTALTGYGVYQFELNEWSFEYSFFQGHQWNYWGSLFTCFGFVCGMMLMSRASWSLRPLAAVGKMALTNYLMHTIICTTLFYGHGFGQFGALNRTQLILVVITIWIFQLIVSPIWLRYFRFGPAEWLWRSLTYWKFQPFLQTNRQNLD
ncbi:MAG: DUF418 domain-containing protein, partial [Planctomycetota bacterium]